MDQAILALFGMPGGYEWIVILIVALLIFGGRLPDVARSLGKSIVEFKKGIRDVKDDLDDTTRLDSSSESRPPLEHKPDATTSKTESEPHNSAT